MTSDTEIKQAYLMWIGKEHYSTIGYWEGEAITRGISKRLPSVEMGKKLLEPGTVIFVAHDEGNYQECTTCLGNIECPAVRKMRHKVDKLDEEMDKLDAKADSIQIDLKIYDEKDGNKEIVNIRRLILNRERKIERLVKEHDEECACKGSGKIEGGTGGYVMVDGELWDYRKYNYHLHQPQLWNPEDHRLDKGMCEVCGGTGRLPLGQVFGLFVPRDVEYILKSEDGEEVKKQMERNDFKTLNQDVLLTEVKRLCGRRKAGGVYVTTAPGTRPSDQAEHVVKELVKLGTIKPDGVEVVGDFIRFLAPVDIHGVKRFRGLKSWSLDPRAEVEAELILEAVA